MFHRHPHAHPPATGMEGRAAERIRLKWAMFFTGAILLAELGGGFASGSLALISDAGHMFVDSISLVLSFIALGIAQRPVTDKYTYGFRRLEILVALLNGMTLLLVCAAICYEGVQRLLVPSPVDVPLMMIIAAIGLAANLGSAMLLKGSSSLNVRSAFLHVLGDLFSSMGILAAGIAMLLLDVPWLDPALSIAIAVVVLVSAYRLTREAVGVLMEAAPEGIDTGKIKGSLMDLPYIEDVHDLHVWTITSGLLALSCHVVIGNGHRNRSDEVITQLSSLLRDRFRIEHSTIQIESADFRRLDERCNGC